MTQGAVGRLSIDRAALQRARRELGLKLPVRVAVVGRCAMQGWYRGVIDGEHRITIRRQTADPPSAVLWHELAHATQRERHGDAYEAEYRRQWVAAGLDWRAVARDDFDEQAFYAMPFEREALELEVRAADHPLFREVAR